MRVVKVLNNSLVLALNKEGEEIILMGKGIGYHKAIGYQFNAKDAEKVFVLKDRELSRSIIRLAAETDSVYFELAKQVIDYAVETYRMQLMEHIYLTITDHIAFAVRRMKEGVIIPNFYIPDMKRFHPEEVAVGTYAVNLIREKLGVELPEAENGNIASHFINAQVDNRYNKENMQIQQLTEDILRIVQYYFQLTYQENSVTYSRYVTHVQLFAQRLVLGNLLPQEQSALLYNQVLAVCSSEFECVKKIEIYVKERFNIEITNQEAMYLALHIHRILEEFRKGILL